MDSLLDNDKVVALTQQIGVVLAKQPFPEAISALSIAMQCTIEDCVQEDKQIDIAASIMGKVINGIVNSRSNANKEPEYEYKKIVAGRGGGIIQSSLDAMVGEGWELAGQNDLEYIFRRKKI